MKHLRLKENDALTPNQTNIFKKNQVHDDLYDIDCKTSEIENRSNKMSVKLDNFFQNMNRKKSLSPITVSESSTENKRLPEKNEYLERNYKFMPAGMQH